MIASLQALLSKAISLEIFQSLRSLLTNSSHVSLGLPLPLLYIIDPLKNPNTHRRLRRPSLDMSKPSQPMLSKFLLNWCHPDPIPNNFIPDSINSCGQPLFAKLSAVKIFFWSRSQAKKRHFGSVLAFQIGWNNDVLVRPMN